MLSARETATSSNLHNDEGYDIAECGVIVVDTYFGHCPHGYVATSLFAFVVVCSVVHICFSYYLDQWALE